MGAPHIIESLDALLQITLSTDAIWMGSVHAITAELQAGHLHLLPGSHAPYPPRMMVYTLERRTLSPAARSIIQAIHQAMRKLEARLICPLRADRSDC